MLCLRLINNRLFSESQIDRVSMHLLMHKISFKAQYLFERKEIKTVRLTAATVPVYLDIPSPNPVHVAPPC